MWGRFIVWFMMVFFIVSYINNSFENSSKHQEVILGGVMVFSFCVVNIEKVARYFMVVMGIVNADRIRAKHRAIDKEEFLHDLWKKEQTLTMKEEIALKYQIKGRIENMKLDDMQMEKLREREEVMKNGTIEELDRLYQELQELEKIAS